MSGNAEAARLVAGVSRGIATHARDNILRHAAAANFFAPWPRAKPCRRAEIGVPYKWKVSQQTKEGAS